MFRRANQPNFVRFAKLKLAKQAMFSRYKQIFACFLVSRKKNNEFLQTPYLRVHSSYYVGALRPTCVPFIIYAETQRRHVLFAESHQSILDCSPRLWPFVRLSPKLVFLAAFYDDDILSYRQKLSLYSLHTPLPCWASSLLWQMFMFFCSFLSVLLFSSNNF